MFKGTRALVGKSLWGSSFRRFGFFFAWFHWEEYVKERAFVRFGQTWAQTRDEKRIWPQSSLHFSASKNNKIKIRNICKSLKDHTSSTRLSTGDGLCGSQQSSDRNITKDSVMVRLMSMKTVWSVQVQISANLVWDAAFEGWWRLKRTVRCYILERVFPVPGSFAFDLYLTSAIAIT